MLTFLYKHIIVFASACWQLRASTGKSHKHVVVDLRYGTDGRVLPFCFDLFRALRRTIDLHGHHVLLIQICAYT